MGTPSSFTSRATSVRNPFASARREPGLVDAGIDRAAEMLEKGTEHSPVEIPTPRRRLNERASRSTRDLRVADDVQP